MTSLFSKNNYHTNTHCLSITQDMKGIQVVKNPIPTIFKS